jgi:hypothetical protein
MRDVRIALASGTVARYFVLDWVSYIDQFAQLAITP